MKSGDKCKITRAMNPECSRKEVGEERKAHVKSCEPEHSERPECTVGDRWETSRNKWKPSVKPSVKS